jgi:hypothetical protein
MTAATPKSAHCQSANRGPGLHNQNAAQDDELGGLIVTDIPAVHSPTPAPTGTDARRSAFLRVSLIQTMLPGPAYRFPARTAQAKGLNSASLFEVDLRMLACGGTVSPHASIHTAAPSSTCDRQLLTFGILEGGA